MKLKFFYLLFLSAFGLFMLGNSGGRATVAGRGNTGAPGDQSSGGVATTCRTCHSTSATTAVKLDIDLFDDNNSSIAATGYRAGETYTAHVTITATAGNPSAYGFQLVALNAGAGVNGTALANWSGPDSHVKIATASFNGRSYAEHNNPNQTNNMFTVKWTAPAAGSGDVTFYSCGNGVDLSTSTSGDAAACNTLTINENTTVGTEDLHSGIEFSVFPNPASEAIFVRMSKFAAEKYELNIISAAGQLMASGTFSADPSGHTESVEISGLPVGLYFVQLVGGHGSFTHKFLKQ